MCNGLQYLGTPAFSAIGEIQLVHALAKRAGVDAQNLCRPTRSIDLASCLLKRPSDISSVPFIYRHERLRPALTLDDAARNRQEKERFG
jgi:hypothetical protein